MKIESDALCEDAGQVESTVSVPGRRAITASRTHGYLCLGNSQGLGRRAASLWRLLTSPSPPCFSPAHPQLLEVGLPASSWASPYCISPVTVLISHLFFPNSLCLAPWSLHGNSRVGGSQVGGCRAWLHQMATKGQRPRGQGSSRICLPLEKPRFTFPESCFGLTTMAPTAPTPLTLNNLQWSPSCSCNSPLGMLQKGFQGFFPHNSKGME